MSVGGRDSGPPTGFKEALDFRLASGPKPCPHPFAVRSIERRQLRFESGLRHRDEALLAFALGGASARNLSHQTFRATYARYEFRTEVRIELALGRRRP